MGFLLAVEVPRAGREEVVVVPARAFLRELLDEVGASVPTEELPRPRHDRECVSVLADEFQLEVGDRFLLRYHFRFPFFRVLPAPPRGGAGGFRQASSVAFLACSSRRGSGRQGSEAQAQSRQARWESKPPPSGRRSAC